MSRPAHITSIALAAFRNHRLSRLVAGDAPFVLLTGPNGAGKTNVLEALSLLAPGRGLRGAALSDMGRAGGEGGFTLAATLVTDPALGDVQFRSWTSADAPERRRLTVNGAASALSGLGQWLSLLWLTPAMDRLFTDAASGRRRFLDRLVLALSPAHGTHAARYDAALRARNRLLAADAAPDPAWMAALEAQMAEHGALVADARSATVAALSAQIAATPEGLFPRPGLLLAGDVPGVDLAAALKAGRAADRAAGRTLAGPHRADLLVRHVAKDMPAAQASTGEQKALLIATLLAHAALVAERTGQAPLLLLDEAVAHLDAGRRAALFERAAAIGGQCWMTGTDAALFDALAAARFQVEDGVIMPG